MIRKRILKHYFNSFYKIDENELEYICQKFEYQEFKKNTILTKEYSVENNIYFIIEGVARLHLDNEEENLTLDLKFNKDIITSYTSFITRSPSVFSLEALTDLRTLKLSYQNYTDVLKNTISGNHITRAIIERNYIVMENKEIDLHKKKATERYLELISKQPKILNNVPLNYIASYLGITPQGLSRIRKQIKNNR